MMTKDRARRGRAAGGLVLLAVLWLAPLLPRAADRFLIWKPAIFSDLLISHLPISRFVHESLARWGQVPLWNPLWLGGQPLLADPLAAMLYPPHWLTYAWPSLGSYNLLLFLHLVWTGFGLYLLAEELGMRPLAAFAAAAAWSGTPRLLGTLGLGHVTLVYAVSWTPWLLLAVHRAAAELPRGGVFTRRFAHIGGLAGLIFLADPRWLLPAGLLAGSYGAVVLVRRRPGPEDWGRAVLGLLLACVLAALLGAGLGLPLLEYIPHTTRAGLEPSAAGRLHVTAADFLGLGFPDPHHWPETNLALGVVATVLAAVALLRGGSARWFWAGAALVSWLLALGNAGPLYPLLSRWLPGAGLLRVPARFQLTAALSAAVLAGHGLDDLLARRLEFGALKRIRLGVVGFVGALVVAVAGLSYLTGPAFLLGRAGTALALLFAGLAAVAVLKGLAGGRKMAQALVVLLVLELVLIHSGGLEARPLEPDVPEPVAARLGAAWGDGRVFSPTYSLPARWAADRGVERADGVHPLQPRRYWNFMSSAVGFPGGEYSVTLPPFPGGDPGVVRYTQPDPGRLGQVNVKWFAAAHPLDAPDVELAGRWDQFWLYKNQLARPRAWIQPDTGLSPSEPWTKVEMTAWSPNRVHIRADGSGWLVLAQNMLPGWEAEVDGREVEVQLIGDVLMGVELPEGEHELIFSYRPRSALAGVAMTLLGLLALLWLGLRS